MDNLIHQVEQVANIAMTPLTLGILWKLSRLVQKVDLMWSVFAREHGLSEPRSIRRMR